MNLWLIIISVFCFLLLTILKFSKKRVKNTKKIKNLTTILKSRDFIFYKIEKEKITEELKKKIENNVPGNLNIHINYQKLIDAGIFNFRPIYKIFVKQLNTKTKKQLYLLNHFENIDVIVLCDTDNIEKFLLNKFKKYKVINIKNINTELLFEINKLNINYTCEYEELTEGVFLNDKKVDNLQYKNYRLESKQFFKNVIFEYYKFLEVADENFFSLKNFEVCEALKIKNDGTLTQNFDLKIIKKIDNEFVNIYKNDGHLQINYADTKTQNFYFSENNFKFFIKKCKKNVFLVLFFEKIKILSNSYLLMTIYPYKKKTENLKNLLFENYCKMNKLFNINFNSDCEKINFIFNKKLGEIYAKHFLNFDKPKKIDLENIKSISSLKKISAIKLYSFEFVKFLISSFLGIEQQGEYIKICPKSDINFFNFNILKRNRNIKIEFKRSENKFVSYGGLQFVNLNNVNVNYVSEDVITFCG